MTALPVWLYCRITGAKFAIDAHTGAFIGWPWERLPGLQRFFVRRALMTIVTNDALAQRVCDAGGDPVVVPDVPTELDSQANGERTPGFHVLFVASFGLDEPIDTVLEAARLVPNVTISITGRPTPRWKSALASRPSNVRLLGFLVRNHYTAAVGNADVVLALTTRDHTMQRAAYEAIYLGTPVVVSDWAVLRRNFESAAIFTRNEPRALADALHRAAQDIERLRIGASELRRHKLDRWQNCRAELVARLTLPC